VALARGRPPGWEKGGGTGDFAEKIDSLDPVHKMCWEAFCSPRSLPVVFSGL